MEGEKELSVRTPMSLTTRVTCMWSSDEFKRSRPPDNDTVAFDGIDREVPIYRPLPIIIKGNSAKDRFVSVVTSS